MSNSTRSNRRRSSNVPSWGYGILLGVFLIALGVSAYFVFISVRDFVAGWQMTDITGPTITTVGGGTPQPGTPSGNGAAPAPITLQKWSGTERVTILLMGIDRRPGEDERGYLTDSMMLLSVDPVAKTGVMLSIPRDLWVEIPGYDNNSINNANRFGDAYEYPGGGPALAMKTVEHNLGINVDYYVRIDFTAFETFVDAVGGIDVDNPADIDDPYYPNGSYGYEPFTLAAGKQHLNGHDALRYARTRHDSSDIDRAKRQQQVVLAVREKILSLNMLPQLLLSAPALYAKLNDSIKTNLTLDQMASLALLAQDVKRENIQNAVIDYRYVLDYTTPEGRQVLIPIREKIRELRDELFTTSAPLSPSGGDARSQLLAEGARVEVLNGAGVEGLAKSTSDWLQAQGVNVVSVDTADRIYNTSSIVVYNNKPATIRWLSTTFNVAAPYNASTTGAVDIQVILGQDWQVP